MLLVDDDDKLRFVLVAHLRAQGYEVLEGKNGREGVALARQHSPDLIIMDLTMPELDGMSATRELKADPQTADVPIIMLTGKTGTDDLVLGLEVGAQEYLTKPFDVAELLARVRTVHRLAVAHRNLDELNNRLEEEVARKTRRLQMLYDYMRALSEVETRDQILDLVLEYVQKTTNARRVSLLMTDASGQNLVCERAVGIDPAVVQSIRIDAGRGIAGQVFSSGKTVVAKAMGPIEADGRGYDGDEFLSTPLVSTSLATRDGILGVLNVTERNDDQTFSHEEVECLRSITDAAAIALHNAMRRSQLEQSVRVLLQTVGYLAEYRDEETTLHLKRVAKFARVLACELAREGPYRGQVTDDFIEWLVQAAPMHDIGKVGIPDEILTKPGKLTNEEFNIMKVHTEIGRRVLSRAFDPNHPVPLLQMCIDIAYGHHERFNGAGYPRGIKGEEIPLAARIIALVDAYDAITSHRRYSKARPHSVAVEVIRAESGKHFDPAVVDGFLRCQAEFDAVRTRYREAPEETPQAAPAAV